MYADQVNVDPGFETFSNRYAFLYEDHHRITLATRYHSSKMLVGGGAACAAEKALESRRSRSSVMGTRDMAHFLPSRDAIVTPPLAM